MPVKGLPASALLAATLLALFVGCAPPVVGVWHIDETQVTADFIGCEREPGRMEGTAFNVGDLTIADDGTTRLQADYRVETEAVYVRWPFVSLDPPSDGAGSWNLDDQSLAIEEGDLLLKGTWELTFVGEEMHLFKALGGSIFEPCGSDSKSISHRLSRDG